MKKDKIVKMIAWSIFKVDERDSMEKETDKQI
jgi:hypothetical protein